MGNEINGWNKRNVDYVIVHGNDNEAYESLLKNLDLREGMLVVDLMCGYGAVSEKILEYCKQRNLGVNLFLLDAYSKQLERSRKTLEPFVNSGQTVVRVKEDARKYAFPPESIDRIVLKFGLHEVKREEQLSILERAIESLKTGGRLFVWESLGQTQEIRDYFGKIVAKKDELASFDSFVENRYFCYEDELIALIRSAGSKEIIKIYEGDFEYVTKRFCETDFGGSVDKLIRWNDYIREIVPDKIAKAICLKDDGDSLKMYFEKKIFMIKKQ